jgi:hypothetical protein
MTDENKSPPGEGGPHAEGRGRQAADTKETERNLPDAIPSVKSDLPQRTLGPEFLGVPRSLRELPGVS